MLSVTALRALSALIVPAQPSRALSMLPTAQDPISAPWGCQPLPQSSQSRAGLQLPTALPCSAMGPTETGPLMGPYPSPASTWPHPQGGAQCPGLGLSRCPSAALLLAGAVGWSLAAGPCHHPCREPLTLPAPDPAISCYL